MGVYLDDIAFIAHNEEDLINVLDRLHLLSQYPGFHINHSKTDIVSWGP